MLTPEERRSRIDTIRTFPDDLEAAISGLSEEQLTIVSLDGEWTVAQNVHHTADSHMNAYTRLKFMLTVDHPTIMTYDENAWSRFADAGGADFDATFSLLRGLHERWVIVWESLTDEEWQRTAYHPEMDRDITVDDHLVVYSNHCAAHLDQIRRTKEAL